VKHRLSVPASQLSALITAGDTAFQQPIVITNAGIILDGYARWELAKRQNRQTILCLEYDLPEEEALRWLIQMHLPSKGMNGFCRSQLASDLEPALRETSRANQRRGGQIKGSSTLTEAEKLDARSELAVIAKVSSGQFTKAKQVSTSAPLTIQQAVKANEISIHKAWQWSRLSPKEQQMKLEEHRVNRGTSLLSKRLMQKHVARMLPTQLIPPSLGHFVKHISPDWLASLDSIVVAEIEAPGRIAYFTQDAMRTLQSSKDPSCPTETS
jgi:hypothetical protein